MSSPVKIGASVGIAALALYGAYRIVNAIEYFCPSFDGIRPTSPESDNLDAEPRSWYHPRTVGSDEPDCTEANEIEGERLDRQARTGDNV